MSEEKKMDIWQKVAIGAVCTLLGFGGNDFASPDTETKILAELQAESKVTSQAVLEIKEKLRDVPTRREIDDIKARLDKLESN